MAISTVSFSNTPQAVNDYYYGYTADWSSLIFLDVMANDLGGKAKTLYSLDDGKTTSDLLSADTARTESMSSDYSKYGAKIWITSDGKVGYDINTLNFQNTIHSLSAGEHLTDLFTYAIRLGNGTLSWATTYIDFVGVNSAPVVLSGNFLGNVLEQNPTDPNLMANGIIKFKDANLNDSHAISFAPSGSVLGSLSIHLDHDTTGSGNSSSGQVSWQYSVSNAAVDYLAAGEIKENKFTITINDGHGGIAVQEVKIIITGTNDAPIITSPMTSGMADEQKDPVGDIVVNSSANIVFNDVDLSDHHSISVVADPNNLAGSSLATMLVSDSTGSGMDGQVSWQYSVAASAAEYLAIGESKVEKFTVTIKDGHGGEASQDVLITINGTNDAPTGSATMGSLDGLEDTPLIISAAALLQGFSDRDTSDHLSVANLSVSHGQLTQLSNGDYQFTPDLNFFGTAALSYDVVDGHGGVAQGNIDMNIIQVNHPPVITSDGGGDTISLDRVENAVAVATVTVSDPDQNDQISFSLSGADADKFSISNAGVLIFAPAPNFEAPTDVGADNTYNVIVRATDLSGAFDEQAIAVNVKNVNEAPVIDSDGGGSSANISIPENSSLVTTIHATDPDAAQTMTYSIVSGLDKALFSIDSHTGELSFINAPNFEAPLSAHHNNNYEVTVRASDGSLFDDQSLSVAITNVNEAPVLSISSMVYSPETGNGHFVNVSVRDPDQGDVLTWIVSENAAGFPDDNTTATSDFEKYLSILPPGVPVITEILQLRDAGGLLSGTVGFYLGTNTSNDQMTEPVNADIAVLCGYGGNDILLGSNGYSYIFGGSGNDILNGGAGRALIMNGGPGNDTYYVNHTQELGAVVELIDAGTDTIISSVDTDLRLTSDLSNIENLTLVKSSDPLGQIDISGTGNNLRNIIHGDTDSDHNILDGKLGNDTYYVGFATTGNSAGSFDSVSEGTDGGGTDIVIINSDNVPSGNAYTLGSNIENLTILGAAGFNASGNGLNNVVSGNSGNNLLSGLGGNDTINGGAGDDILVGGAGSDILTGGSGSDTFSYNLISDSNGTSSTDLIQDFQQGVDKIDLSAIFNANGYNASNVAFVADDVNNKTEIHLYDSSAQTNQVMLITLNGLFDAAHGNALSVTMDGVNNGLII